MTVIDIGRASSGPETYTHPQVDEGVFFSDVLSPIDDRPPTEAEVRLLKLGRFIEDLRESSEITQLTHLETVDDPHGTLHRYGFVTEAGYAYSGNVTIPDRQTSNIPILATAAWGTSPRGHNEHTARAFLEDGIPMIYIGNEGSYRPDEKPAPDQEMSLALTAAAALSFSRVVSRRDFSYLLDPIKRTAVGESKGGMEGQGTVALAEFFDQEMLMADFTAACLPKEIEWADLPELSKQLLSEPLTFIRLGGRLALGLVLHYPATLDLHPRAVSQQAGKWRPIKGGETGDLARLIDYEQIMHLTNFKQDPASMEKIWRQIFAGYPNIRITPLDGSHLTIADPETLAYIRARQRAFRELYVRYGNRLRGDDGRRLFSGPDVFNLAHRYVGEYTPHLPASPVQKVVRLLFGGSPTRHHRELRRVA